MELENLFQAAQRNDLDAVKSFLGRKRKVTTTDDDEDTKQKIAFVAAKNCYMDMLKYILERDISILKPKEDDRTTIIELAVEGGMDIDGIKYLVEKYKTNFSKEGNDHAITGRAVHLAIRLDRLNILKYFVEEKTFNLNEPVEDYAHWPPSDPPLFVAVQHQRQDIMEYLIDEKKVDLSTLNSEGENILFVVIRRGNMNLLKYVLDKKKANIHMDSSLVRVAIQFNRMEILKYLVDDKHVDFHQMDKKCNSTPLHSAILKDHFEMCKFLIDRGADVKEKDFVDRTPLHWAASSKLCQYLIKHGAKVNAKDKQGKTPLHCALVDHCNLEKCEILLTHGANINQKDIEGNTPLHVAAFRSTPECYQYLINRGADVKAENKDGKNPSQLEAVWDEAKLTEETIIKKGSKRRIRRNVLNSVLSYGYAQQHSAGNYAEIRCLSNGEIFDRAFEFMNYLMFFQLLVAFFVKSNRTRQNLQRNLTRVAEEAIYILPSFEEP